MRGPENKAGRRERGGPGRVRCRPSEGGAKGARYQPAFPVE